MPKRTPSGPDERDERIQRLSMDLYLTRTALISFAPDELRPVLEAQLECEARDDLLDWESWAIERVVDVADERLLPGLPGRPRSMCPLCGRGTRGPYEDGFAIPLGLARHLGGESGANQCTVFGAAWGLGFDRTDPRRIRPKWAPTRASSVPPWKQRAEMPPTPARPSAKVLPFGRRLGDDVPEAGA